MKTQGANRLLKECALEEKCAYLPGQEQTTHYKIISHCSPAYCDHLIRRGWRRFGEMFFRPICSNCSACESIKIDVNAYRFSRSEKRVLRKNEDLTVMIRRPGMSRRHLELFSAYHRYMHHRRGWDEQPVTPRNYYSSFVHGYNDFGYEVLYFDRERLIGVDLIDILPSGISSIYFYYDPEYADRSLGKYSLLQQISLAKERGLPWIYLGYYVEGCQSLMYKRDYTPLLQLQGRPAEEESDTWTDLPS
ncbi:arginyltransferase [Sulfurimonas sp. HSL-1656]|uniref:arginyltransferase n=1 Tax=Thiomicrolovo subterrani TaxID=3131934 RepID=UPI0031F83D1D